MTARRLAVLVACLVAVLGWTLPAEAQDNVVVRTSLKPESGAVVGQHVRLFVDVLFADGMPRPPRVEMPEMPGAQIFRFETQATTMNDTIGGQAYVGQRFEFALYGRRGGTLVVPAPRVILLNRDGNETGALQGKAIQVEIAMPPGVDASQVSIASTKVTLDEQWAPAPTTAFKAGDALVRTITRQADDVPGMAMRDFALAAPPGVRVYAEPPQTDDRVERGELTGRRIDRVTYVFESGGRFEIGSVSQPWWALDTRRLRQAEGLGVTVSVAAATAGVHRGWLLPAIATGGVVLLGLGWWAAARLKAADRARRQRWQRSEEKAFHDLLAVCRHGDAAAIYQAFAIWRRRVPRGDALAPLAEELELTLFGGVSWSADRSRLFAGKARVARRAMIECQTPRTTLALPPLNPPTFAA